MKKYRASFLDMISYSQSTLCLQFLSRLQKLENYLECEGTGQAWSEGEENGGDDASAEFSSHVTEPTGKFLLYVDFAQQFALNSWEQQMTETNSHEELMGKKTLEKMSDRCNVVSPSLKLLSYSFSEGWWSYQSPQCRNLHSSPDLPKLMLSSQLKPSCCWLHLTFKVLREIRFELHLGINLYFTTMKQINP